VKMKLTIATLCILSLGALVHALQGKSLNITIGLITFSSVVPVFILHVCNEVIYVFFSECQFYVIVEKWVL
jgi:hypothetical protein